MTKTEGRNFKTDWIRKQIFIEHGKEIWHEKLELLAVVWGLDYFRLLIYGKPVEFSTDHQALEPLCKRNRPNKHTHTARD